ncbi:MAG: hypothetical protein K2N89_07595 [Lachnospiraceae bacterium]|nr:hypothetical protein [Lachnospiraceae bacterium]
MTEKELHEKWSAFGAIDYDKSLFIEYIYLCNFTSDEDFYYYLHPDEATKAQFLSVLEFLYHQGCYMLLYRFLRDNKDRLVFPDFKRLEGITLREDIEERFKQYCF